ncbi:MAG: TIGR03752 family integrating conjugative element protein [Gammaproteobacteria bacterium]|nr:TIGR03752 family integrating conjugative element protein [Gammaproteobacteria bacterium]
MAVLRSNRLLPLIGITVVLMAAFVGLKSCGTTDSDSVVMDRVPRAPAADADTPAETIKTLTARVAELMNHVKALRNENDELLRRNREIENSVANRVKRELEDERARKDNASESVLSGLTERIDALAGRVSTLSEDNAARSIESTTPDSDIPVGLGLSDDASPVHWVEPLDREPPDSEQTGRVAALASRAGSILEGDSQVKASRTSAPANRPASDMEKTEQEPEPVYTVPRNATLIGSTAMTALVGRIPVQGTVQDPMPFKILVGGDNLAANGLTIPGIEGMVWSGTAVGDWTLSCVTGRLTSVTFVFQDGAIRTISSDQGGEPLGWISDERGIPCISGERITNAPSFLMQRIGVTALQAGADAAAQAETTTTISDTGRGTSNVTGDVSTHVLGNTVSGGASEIRRWLDERQAQSFDAVFVRPSEPIAVHVDRRLDIDHDPQGRKVNHAQNLDSYRRARLD